MGLLLAFAPFIAFALLNHLAGAATGLTAGAAVAAALLLRDWMTPGRTAKVLEIGTVLLFGGLALYAFTGGPAWSIVRVRLWVDAGLLLIVLVSMAIRQPFTIQYARERVARTLWDNPVFVRTNYIITGVWAVAFAVMVIARPCRRVSALSPRCSPFWGRYSSPAGIRGACGRAWRVRECRQYFRDLPSAAAQRKGIGTQI